MCRKLGKRTERHQPVPEYRDLNALETRIRQEMDAIKDPCSVASGLAMGLDEMGILDGVDIAPDGHVTLTLRLTSPFCHMIGFFKTESTQLVSALHGVSGVTLKADNGLDWTPDRISAAGQARHDAHLTRMRERGVRRNEAAA